MYYVSYIEEYPIFEAAEGGYFYPGETVVETRAFKTWRKARQLFNRWRKRFEQEHADENSRVFRVTPGSCNRYGDGPEIGYNSRYVGDGCAVRLTRYEPKDKGYTPYC